MTKLLVLIGVIIVIELLYMCKVIKDDRDKRNKE